MKKNIKLRDQSRNSDRSDLSSNSSATELAMGKEEKGSKQISMIKSDKFSREIKIAKEIAVRLAERRAVCKEAEQKRDATLYRFFATLIKMKPLASEIGRKGAKVLIKRHFPDARPSFTSAEHFLLALTYPNLDAKQRAKYAKTLKYVSEHKKDGGTVKSFVRKHGGINGCS